MNGYNHSIASFPFLANGGAVGALMRTHDWSTSPLGHPETWPHSLRAVVGLLLNSKFPMFVAWGPELGFLYNDAYAEILGAKHPMALGRRFQEIWSEIWGDILPLIERALAGEATYHENLPLTMQRRGFEEQTWFTFSYSPVRDESGNVAGMYCACVETTNQVLAEKYRNEENERFRTLFAQAPGFMALVRGPDHVFDLTNNAYLQLIGHRQILGKPVREALPEVAGQGFYELLDKVYTSGEPFVGHALPIKLQREPNGPLEERFVDFVYQPIRDARGAVTGIFAEGSDVTEHKLAEEALRTARTRLEATLNAAEIGTWLFDLKADKVYADPSMARLYGVSEADANGGSSMAYFNVIHSDDVDTVKASVERSIATGEPYQDIYRVCLPDGEYRIIHARGKIEFDSDGVPAWMPGVALDITRQRQAEEALRSSEERFRTLIRSMDEGYCVLQLIFNDAGHAVDYRYVEANLAFEKQSGLVNAIGKTIREMVPDIESRWIEAYGRVAMTGEPVRLVEEAVAMGRWFEVYATRTGSPEDRQVAVLFKDITEQKRTERELRQLAADLSEANRRKTEFLATLAHELRNPLAPIRTGLELMRMGSDNAATVARVREMMGRQVDHLVHLINDLLDIARINSGKVELKKARVTLKDIVASGVETSLPLIEANQHELAVDVPDEPLWLDADHIRLAQVLSNLLTNAAKYTSSGGRISLSARKENDEVVISVTDNGLGIPAEALPRLFDMFSQVGRNMTHAQGGLGIGLSLVKRLVEMHDGTVSATSDGPGQGSTFTVRLPLANSNAAANTLADPRMLERDLSEKRQLRIVIADDNEDAANVLAELLQISGHITQVAHDGRQAIEMIQSFKPDLALLDIGMPGMNGYEVAKAIRNTPQQRSMTLVALTGWGAHEDRTRSKEAGLDYHLTKPVDMAALNNLLSLPDSSSKRACAWKMAD